jgi:hypothetical protein
VLGLPTDRSIFSPTDGGIRCYFGQDLPPPRLCGYCGVPPHPHVEHVPECPLSDESLGLNDPHERPVADFDPAFPAVRA